VKHRAIPDTKSRRDVGCIEDAANFLHREMAYERLIVSFTWDGTNLSHLRQSGGHAEFNIAEEGLDGSEAPITCCCSVAALLLDMKEKIENYLGSNLLKTYL
jgi:hypothetical protein